MTELDGTIDKRALYRLSQELDAKGSLEKTGWTSEDVDELVRDLVSEDD